jgi:hypothetical protein
MRAQRLLLLVGRQISRLLLSSAAKSTSMVEDVEDTSSLPKGKDQKVVRDARRGRGGGRGGQYKWMQRRMDTH